MAEIKIPPITNYDEGGNPIYIFTDEHSIADIARWIVSEGYAVDMIYLLEEMVRGARQ